MDQIPVKPDSSYEIGQALRSLLGGGRRMGSWTGLPPILGAPIGGALVGAGLGGIYGLGKDLLTGDRPRRPWWRRPAAIGAMAGGGLGVVSGVAQHLDKAASLQQKRASMESAYLIRSIERDPSITYYEKNRLVGLVNQATPSQLGRLAALLAAGSLTAAAAHTVLGTGFFGSAVIGGLAGMTMNGIFPGPAKYV